jgi:hypothetical protein
MLIANPPVRQELILAKSSLVRFSPFLLLSSVLVLSCGAAHSGPQEGAFAFSAVARANARSHVPAEATSILLDLLEAYYWVKDGFVADDAKQVSKAVIPFSRAVGRLDTFIVTSSSGYYHLWPSRDSLRDAAHAMQASTVSTDVNVLRIHFSKASSALHSILRLASLRGARVYRFYDAAAFNDSGAYWLSHSPETNNPYFGRKMPEWGELIDSLE